MSPLDQIPYELRVWLPYAAMFLILFAICFHSFRDFSTFDRRTSAVLAVCVSLLALFGMDQAIIKPVMASYSAMGAVMLVSLAVLLVVIWLTLIIRGRKR